MARLLLFALCDRVIVADNDTLSLVTLVDAIACPRPAADADPQRVATDDHIYVVSRWHRDEATSSEGDAYAQRLTIRMPNGEIWGAARETAFNLVAPGHTVVQRLDAFPIGFAGTYHVILELSEAHANTWRVVSEYPVVVLHQPPTPV